MEFLEAPAFTLHLGGYLDDEQYRGIQDALANTPELGDMMPGTGGFRKLRWADTRRGKGRRGGLRVIYYWFEGQNQIWLITAYDKNEAVDLTPETKKSIEGGDRFRKEITDTEIRTGDGKQAESIRRTDGRCDGHEGASYRENHAADL